MRKTFSSAGRSVSKSLPDPSRHRFPHCLWHAPGVVADSSQTWRRQLQELRASRALPTFAEREKSSCAQGRRWLRRTPVHRMEYESRVYSQSGSPVWCDDGTPLYLAVVEEVVRLGRAFQWKVFNQHLDFSILSETDYFQQLGDRAPEG